jgi:hypothetical protein
MSEKVGASTSRKPKGFHGLYRDNFTLPFTEVISNILESFFRQITEFVHRGLIKTLYVDVNEAFNVRVLTIFAGI